MALTIFRRHLKKCAQKDRYFRRCQCPIHVEGTLGSEEVRKGLNLTSWEAAQNLIAEWNRAGKVGGDRVEPVAVTEAVELYLADVAARVSPSTVRLHRVLLRDSLLPWCEREGIKLVNRLDVKALVRYRAGWSYAPLTALKKFERLGSFFGFCTRAKWVTENPMKAMKPPKADTPPTMPFTDAELERIYEAARGFKIQGSYGKDNPVRVVAYVYLLRYSGLRISDATGLAKDRVTPDGRLFLHMQRKTRVPVFVPLPPFVVAALTDLDRLYPARSYYFWTGTGKLDTAVKSWKRTLARVFELAGLKVGKKHPPHERAHPHRFRDTFAVSLLLKGVPLEDVAELLGHTSTKVTEKSYAPWVKARQDKLEERVRLTWEEPKPRLRVITGGA
jgi:integrase/recombinase XerD